MEPFAALIGALPKHHGSGGKKSGKKAADRTRHPSGQAHAKVLTKTQQKGAARFKASEKRRADLEAAKARGKEKKIADKEAMKAKHHAEAIKDAESGMSKRSRASRALKRASSRGWKSAAGTKAGRWLGRKTDTAKETYSFGKDHFSMWRGGTKKATRQKREHKATIKKHEKRIKELEEAAKSKLDPARDTHLMF